MQLAIANAEKQQCLNALLEREKPSLTGIPGIPYDINQQKQEAKPKLMTWNMRRQMLEAEDRKTAELQRKKIEEETLRKSVEILEKELGVTDAQAVRRNDEESIQSGQHEKEEASASS
jgi:hypothetical protein